MSSSGSAAKTRRTQQERSEEARAKLLAAAIELIADRGFAQTTMADVAQLAGFTRGAIQHHFEGRDELALAIIHSVESNVTASFDAVSPGTGHGVGARIDFLIDTLGAIVHTRAYLAVVDIWLASRSNTQLDSEVRNSMLRSSDSFKRLWFRIFSGDVPPMVIADCRRVVVNIMRGAVVSQMLIPNTRSIEQMLETAKQMVRHHMLGSAATSG